MGGVDEREYPHARLTYAVIGAAMEVHRVLGEGFLESVYEEALGYEMELRGIEHQRQVSLEVGYKGRVVRHFVADFIVDGEVVVEVKAMQGLGRPERAQVVNYLRATGKEVGLLLNFGAGSLEYQRVVNGTDGRGARWEEG